MKWQHMLGIYAALNLSKAQLLSLLDPADAIKGQTWGPSSVQKDRRQRTSVILSDGRWSKSAPSLEKSLHQLSGGHSNFTALKEICKCFI